MPSEIQLVAQDASKACTAAINHPKSTELRLRLLDALDQIAELVRVDDLPDSNRTSELLSQIAHLGRCRAPPGGQCCQQRRLDSVFRAWPPATAFAIDR